MTTSVGKKKQKLKRPGTTANDIFSRLMEAILNGEYPGNTPLREAKLARHWGVSRTPLREAVRRAAEAGLVVLRPNQAPIVRSLTVESVDNLYTLRELLELHAFESAWPLLITAQTRTLDKLATAARPGKSPDWPRACLDFDRAMHASWEQHCGNSWLTSDLERLSQFLHIFQSWIGQDHQWLAKSYAEHIGLLNAIKRRNKAEARNCLRIHIRNSADLVRKLAAQTTLGIEGQKTKA